MTLTAHSEVSETRATLDAWLPPRASSQSGDPNVGDDRESADLIVIAQSAGMADCVVGDEREFAALARALDELSEGGREVRVLIPRNAMGRAHVALSGLSVVLQPWWKDGNRVRFGVPEPA